MWRSRLSGSTEQQNSVMPQHSRPQNRQSINLSINNLVLNGIETAKGKTVGNDLQRYLRSMLSDSGSVDLFNSNVSTKNLHVNSSLDVNSKTFGSELASVIYAHLSGLSHKNG